METVTVLFPWAPKTPRKVIEIKRQLVLERKAMTNWQCIKKQRYHFANKGTYSHNYDYSSSHIQTWQVDDKEGWTLKNWCFWIVVLEKTLESPLDCKEIKSILKVMNPGYTLEGLILNLKLPYFGLLMQRADSLEKTLMLGKIEGKRRKGRQRMRWLDNIPDYQFEQTLGGGGEQRCLVCWFPWGCSVGHDLGTKQQQFSSV